MFSFLLGYAVLALCVVLIFVFMRPRRYYLIRHGETLLNAEHVRQGVEGPLSRKGRAQAAAVARALESLPIGRILSSSYPRARETAEILQGKLHSRIRYSPLLGERRNPREIIGKSVEAPEAARIVDQIDLAVHEDDYRFSDEENFADLKARAEICLVWLARQHRREIVVVTHHHFLKMLIAYMLYRERLHAADFVKLSFFNVSDNAGITVCEYHPWKRFSRTRGWEILAFNQQAQYPQLDTGQAS
ncbi:histidine phosphatase family protein [Candidatus Kaiserbacteria bacterium]|nr:histidine phosphatase family protein [Candidatus Kaiserbacteria bacterium]